MIRRVVVIGAGIAGLAAAHRLLELKTQRSLDLHITLLEASSRLGGAIATERIGECMVEAGPDSFITEKPWALKLCERIGLASDLISTQSAYQKIYVVHDGKLKPLPEGFFLLAPTRFWSFVRSPIFSWAGKLRIAGELLTPRRKSMADESLASFVRRRFGDEALNRVAQPLVGGIYAADPEKLSLGATMPRFLEMERRYRSVIYAVWSAQRKRAHRSDTGSGARWSLFVSLTGGMQQLVDTLAKRLPAGCVRLRSRVRSLDLEDQRVWRITTAEKETLGADGVILAVPAFCAAEITAAFEPTAARQLAAIPYASTATVSLAYHLEDFPQPLDSFGFVVPAIERRKVMACTFNSLKYPGRAPPGKVLLRAFVGGTLQQELFGEADSIMAKNVRRELASLLGVNAEPLFSRVWRHPQSMPQYLVGHEERIRRIVTALERFPTLGLAGSAYRGVGIADCVHTGEEAAEAVIDALSKTAGNGQ
jgi:oxygen-dependent protoporphyrinogen oxidase